MSSPSAVEPFDQTGPSGESKPADSPLEIYRHSSAHLLAAAVMELFPDTQCGIGPPTDDGFFYDALAGKVFLKLVLDGSGSSFLDGTQKELVVSP